MKIKKKCCQNQLPIISLTWKWEIVFDISPSNLPTPFSSPPGCDCAKRNIHSYQTAPAHARQHPTSSTVWSQPTSSNFPIGRNGCPHPCHSVFVPYILDNFCGESSNPHSFSLPRFERSCGGGIVPFHQKVHRIRIPSVGVRMMTTFPSMIHEDDAPHGFFHLRVTCLVLIYSCRICTLGNCVWFPRMRVCHRFWRGWRFDRYHGSGSNLLCRMMRRRRQGGVLSWRKPLFRYCWLGFWFRYLSWSQCVSNIHFLWWDVRGWLGLQKIHMVQHANWQTDANEKTWF